MKFNIHRQFISGHVWHRHIDNITSIGNPRVYDTITSLFYMITPFIHLSGANGLTVRIIPMSTVPKSGCSIFANTGHDSIVNVNFSIERKSGISMLIGSYISFSI